ncbi:MAG: 16S rRNA (uracil(1498)-N(3))-methyltransferase [Verrucomicrobiaceae bacterium]|nr:MAG: 16S rRNA (uracil(1498)-N(3))-methyltransferase [Verrucomicrobiaceae bacterium]
MTLHRFYIPPAQWNPSAPVLDEAESRHAAEVLRLKPGDAVSVFNGEGIQAEARISRLGKREVALEITETRSTAPPAARLLLAQAVPKGKNMDLVMQKATELGASGLIPLITERTVVRLSPEEAADKQEKWQRIVIEACKQCGQNFLPQVHRPAGLETFLSSIPSTDLRLVAAIEPGAKSLKTILSDWSNAHAPAAAGPDARPSSALVLIGPEGDFTPAELAKIKAAGCQPLTLGPIILRTETAAIYTLSVLAHELF